MIPQVKLVWPQPSGPALGAAFGGVFAAYISANFRGKRVGDLSPARFAFGGALVPIPFIFVLAASAQSWKGWIFLGDLIIPVAFVAALGGLTAYGTVKLAQKSLPPGQLPDELDPGFATASRSLPKTGDIH